MRYSNTERVGVNKVEEIVLSELNWIFRELNTVDVGIDAFIEQVQNGNPCGKFIALQIKSGLGNFHESENSFTYYVTELHYNYWISFNIPVIIVAYIPEYSSVYWNKIDEQSLKKTKTQWKLNISKKSKLTKRSIKHLNLLISEKSQNYAPFKLLLNESIDGEIISDLVAKAGCLEDSVDSTSIIISQIEELRGVFTRAGKEFENQKNKGLMVYDFEVQATIKNMCKKMNLGSKRIRSEMEIFSASIGEAFYALEQSSIILYDINNNKSKLIELNKPIFGIPESIDKTVKGVSFMQEKLNEIPNATSNIKESKHRLNDTINYMLNEYANAKNMVNKYLFKLEML